MTRPSPPYPRQDTVPKRARPTGPSERRECDSPRPASATIRPSDKSYRSAQSSWCEVPLRPHHVTPPGDAMETWASEELACAAPKPRAPKRSLVTACQNPSRQPPFNCTHVPHAREIVLAICRRSRVRGLIGTAHNGSCVQTKRKPNEIPSLPTHCRDHGVELAAAHGKTHSPLAAAKRPRAPTSRKRVLGSISVSSPRSAVSGPRVHAEMSGQPPRGGASLRRPPNVADVQGFAPLARLPSHEAQCMRQLGTLDSFRETLFAQVCPAGPIGPDFVGSGAPVRRPCNSSRGC